MRQSLLLSFGTFLTNASLALAQALPMSTAPNPTALLSLNEAISGAPAKAAPEVAAGSAAEVAPAPPAVTAPAAAPEAAKPAAPGVEIQPTVPPVPALPAVGPLSPHCGPGEMCSPPKCEEEKKPGPRCWIDGQYLLWWIKDAPIPVPLITTGNPADAVPGAFGQPGTAFAFGPTKQDLGTFTGGRLTVGGWLNEAGTLGLEASGFLLETRRVGYFAGSAGDPPLFFVPFVNSAAVPPVEAALPFGTGDASSGALSVFSSARLWGSEANLLVNAVKSESYTLTMLGGFRYLDLSENLQFNAFGVDPDNRTLSTVDQFNTRNQFWGGQLGARGEVRMGGFFVNLSGKVGLGANHESITTNGVAVQFMPAAAAPLVVVPGGLFVQTSNAGRTTANHFAVLPEARAEVGYDVTANVRVFAGYDFLYLSDVVRPGYQIDRNINFTQQALPVGGGGLVGPATPVPQFNHSDFWAQGVNVGIAFRF
jgi:hypothetical protein